MMEGKLIEEEMRIVTGIWDYFVILDDYIMIDKEEFGENIEDAEDSKGIGTQYHEKKFYELMTTMVRFFPEDDSEPVYYSAGRTNTMDNW